LTLKAPDDGPLRGRLPSGLTVTIAGTDYVTTADATADKATNRITATITPGLDAEGADDAVVTLASAVSYAHPKVNLRAADERDQSFGSASGKEITNVAGFPGHLAPAWIERGDRLIFTRKNGIVTPNAIAEAVQQRGWGQVVFA
jgi:hypothetical protein